MKKMKYFTARALATILVGALTAGSLTVSAFGAEEFPNIANTSEIEDLDSTAQSDLEDTEPFDSDTNGEDDAVVTYTVTLDANGGYFEDAWDDVLEEHVDRAEVITKVVPAGDSIEIFPKSSQDNQSLVFQGWSLERDGDLIAQEYEKFIPEEDCTLYAVWGWETELVEDIVENTEETLEENPREPVDVDLMDQDESKEGSKEEQVSEENIDQQKVTVSGRQQDKVNSVSGKILYSGSLGDNLTWTLDEEGTMIITGMGDMIDGSLYYQNDIKKVIIEDGVTSIGACAFENCRILTEK